VLDPRAGLFAAGARDPALAEGVWPVDRPELRLESLDVDGAVRKCVALASGPDASEAADRSAPPALRNDGIALVHTGRARALHGRIASSRELRASIDSTDEEHPEGSMLTAEDLVRGYRVDVWDDVTGAFHSLHARQVRYTVEGFGALPAADGLFSDEGFFQESLTGDTELLIHERLLTWRGWSLSVPRLETVLRGIDRPFGDPDALSALHARLFSQVQRGTLPKLRFGRRYRFRLRTVDLAGNSIDLEAAPDIATSELRYLRYEPVLPPVFAPVVESDVFAEGETMHRLVIREPVPPDEWTTIPVDAGPPSERLLLPPRGTVALVEQHGRLDVALGNTDRTRRADTRALVARADAELSYPIGEFAPYLPDPQAAGVAFAGLPGVAPGEVFTVPFEADPWDAVRPIRLRLASSEAFVAPPEGGLPPSYDQASRTLTVFLGAGRTCTVRVSSILRDPDLMALLHDVGERRGGERDLIASRVRNSLHTMFTPYREIELVHATPTAGRIDFQSDLAPVRGVGEASVGFRTSIAVDPSTTDSVALHASWTEHVERGEDGLPTEVTRSERVASWRLPPNASAVLPAIPGDGWGRHLATLDTDELGLPRQQFADTGYRLVSYTPVTTSRFADCYPSGRLVSGEGESTQVHVLNSAVPPPPVVHSVVPSQVVFPQSVERSEDHFDVGPPGPGPPDELPSEPGWTRTTQLRRGGGIRVYLERPWFLTGADESLGVILVSPDRTLQSFPDAPENSWNFNRSNPLPQWVSQAGQDPIRRGRGVSALTASDFLNPTQSGSVSILQGAVDADDRQVPATILGYVPRFEESSGLWCADVQVNADAAYMPFFRLAVGRYQKNSLNEEVSLSRVSTIDIVQPLPSRTLTILRHVQDPGITVTLWGSTYPIDDPRLAARVTARLYMGEAERRDLVPWRLVEEVAEFDLVRDANRGLWSATTSLPPPQPGRVLRLLVVEREQMRDQRPGSQRIVYVGTIDL